MPKVCFNCKNYHSPFALRIADDKVFNNIGLCLKNKKAIYYFHTKACDDFLLR